MKKPTVQGNSTKELELQLKIGHSSGVHIRMDKPRFMKQMACFWPSLVGNKKPSHPSHTGSTLVLIVSLKEVLYELLSQLAQESCKAEVERMLFIK